MHPLSVLSVAMTSEFQGSHAAEPTPGKHAVASFLVTNNLLRHSRFTPSSLTVSARLPFLYTVCKIKFAQEGDDDILHSFQLTQYSRVPPFIFHFRLHRLAAPSAFATSLCQVSDFYNPRSVTGWLLAAEITTLRTASKDDTRAPSRIRTSSSIVTAKRPIPRMSIFQSCCGASP